MFSRNGTASALELVLTLPIREADFTIEPGKGDQGECDFVRSVLMTPDQDGGMRTPIQELIGQVTSGQIYRRAFFLGGREDVQDPRVRRQGDIRQDRLPSSRDLPGEIQRPDR